MISEEITAAVIPEAVEVSGEKPVMVDEEEFFARELFEDVLEMKSLRKVSEATEIELNKLQDQAYQCLSELFQKNRDGSLPDNNEVFGLFELFFKNYYQHFRTAMEALLVDCSPVKVAYSLGKSTDKMLALLDQIVAEIKKEVA